MPESAHDTAVSSQLPLQLKLQDDATLDNFYPRNSLAQLLGALEKPAQEPLQLLHGPAATGKSHLLQAICHSVPGALYLPMAELETSPPEALFKDLERAPLIALDDLQAVAGRADWEEGLFHLVNRARAAECALWVAARRPARDMGIVLPDLASRLAGGVTWAITTPGDADKEAILRFRAKRRGLILSAAVAQYVCARDSRALDDLIRTLDRLDHASLQMQRALTVPLVRQVMGW